MSMTKYEETLQKMVNLSYEELVERGQYYLAEIMPALNDIAKDGNGAGFLIAIVGTCVTLDGTLSGLEVQFLNDVLELDASYDEMFEKFSQFYCDEAISLSDKIAQALSSDDKVNLAIFCTCLLAVDEKIASNENAFIQMLLS